MGMENRLKEIRKSRGLSQEALGDKCNPPIRFEHISRYENGVHFMQPDVLERIAKALGVHPYEIYDFGPLPKIYDVDEDLMFESLRVCELVAKQRGAKLSHKEMLSYAIKGYKIGLEWRKLGKKVVFDEPVMELILGQKTA